MVKIDEQNKTIESLSYDIRNKGISLDDTEKEVARVRDINS